MQANATYVSYLTEIIPLIQNIRRKRGGEIF